MYRSRLTLSLLVASGLVVGCSDSSPLTVEERNSLLRQPTVGAPVLTQADLVQSTVTGEGPGPGPDGPALVAFDEDATFGDDDGSRPPGQIFNADTRIAFEPGYVGIYGTHDYSGNVGHILTTGHVTYQDQHLGSQSAEKQKYVPFLTDFGLVKNIWVFPKVYADHECGLKGEGESKHSAWWEFFRGTGVSTWGRAMVTTIAQPASQGACSGGGSGGYESEREGAGGMTCTYWITYDVNTGVIVDAELLYCSSGGGAAI